MRTCLTGAQLDQEYRTSNVFSSHMYSAHPSLELNSKLFQICFLAMSKIAIVKLEQFWQYKRQNDQMYIVQQWYWTWQGMLYESALWCVLLFLTHSGCSDVSTLYSSAIGRGCFMKVPCSQNPLWPPPFSLGSWLVAAYKKIWFFDKKVKMRNKMWKNVITFFTFYSHVNNLGIEENI